MKHRNFSWLFISTLLAIAVVIACSSNTEEAPVTHWTHFRGSQVNGHAAQDQLDAPLEWGESQNIAWKTPIHGQGWSCPVIWEDQIWLTTADAEGHNQHALCIDRKTGEILFDEQIFYNENPRPLGNQVNTYASPSSAIEDGRVYVNFGSYGTACIDTERFETLWVRRDLPCNHFRGPAASPIIFEDLLILTFDGADFQYQAALDKETGHTRWITGRTTRWRDVDQATGLPKRGGDFRKAYGTPKIVEVNGEPRMLITASYGAFSYNPRTGDEIWRLDHNGYSPASMALYDNGIAYLISGRSRPELMAIPADQTGVIKEESIEWSVARGIPSMVSPILVNGLIFTIDNGGVIGCIDAETGELIWQDRLPGEYYASPLHADGRIYFFNTHGVATVISADEEGERLAENTLEDGFMATPAIIGDSIYARTTTHLYRIQAAE